MNTSLTRRNLLASVGLAATGAGVSAATLDPPNAVQAPEGKRATLLHFTDTHAQLETHQDYLPGADEEIQMMGGYARLKTAIERERATAKTRACCWTAATNFRGLDQQPGRKAR
jgi:S-sulfosulfanyl-L-cysteine sulfohydrolase